MQFCKVIGYTAGTFLIGQYLNIQAFLKIKKKNCFFR